MLGKLASSAVRIDVVNGRIKIGQANTQTHTEREREKGKKEGKIKPTKKQEKRRGGQRKIYGNE